MLGLLLCFTAFFSLHAPLLTLRSYAVYLRRPPATTFRFYPLEPGPRRLRPSTHDLPLPSPQSPPALEPPPRLYLALKHSGAWRS